MTVGAWEVGTGEGRRHEGKLRQWTNVWISGGLVGGFGGVVGSGLLPRSTSQAGAGGEAGATTTQPTHPGNPNSPRQEEHESSNFFFSFPLAAIGWDWHAWLPGWGALNVSGAHQSI